ncbi:T9SS type A sorting domain-containing protein [Candidatus Amoebophilus asiaticus]|nr:T9SS type A sorting domain-containing protein [Candidatus Amoebophilus asiaticus]
MKALFLICLSLPATPCLGQQTINDTITHDGLQRSFILYVPASYSPGSAAPLVINFHGYTSNANDQMNYGDFRLMADTAGFLLVHPMGTMDSQGQPYWNANWGGTVDDIGFTEALIDSLASGYNVDLNRVYSTGMSNGGFMSYTLACELSNRIAAIASVTGTMNLNQSLTCNPQRPMPVMEIHGTADATVPYNGSSSMESIENTLAYWTSFNQCDTPAIVTNVPDINEFDDCTAEHHIYQNGGNGVEVEHYKIIDGGHTWPGASNAIGTTNYDIDASFKIWEFFAKYDINGRISAAGIDQLNKYSLEVKIYPNPAQDFVTVKWNGSTKTSIRVLNVLGVEVSKIDVNEQNTAAISIQGWSNGMYLIAVDNNEERLAISKFMVVRFE